MYRPDIDGLRTVAIVPVVLFHAGALALSGGFVGVDIFFVISGFLISTILINDIQENRYSVVAFYERRIRRILPAFTLVAVVTLVGSYFALLPHDLWEFGASEAAAALFSSNFFFWSRAADYFNGSSELKPFLHTWSLSVEEQFYIFFPLLLLLFAKKRRWPLAPWACLGCFILSLGASLYGTAYAPVASFYFLPTRAWELLVGSFLAFGLFKPPRSPRQASAEAWLGALLIAAALFFYDDATPFPGLAAVLPTFGAAFILHAGADDKKPLVNRLLSTAPFRFIGLISYSLYLWHWPIIVLARYCFVKEPAWLMPAAVALSFLLAVLSWRFIERPFRKPDGVMKRSALFVSAGITLVLLVVAGSAFTLDGGLPYRVPKAILTMADRENHQGPQQDCGHVYADRRTVNTLCRLGKEGRAPDFLFLGDSHATMLAAALSEAASAAGKSGLQITDTNYRPLWGFKRLGDKKKYAYLNDLAAKTVAANPTLSSIAIALYWPQATLTDRYADARGRLRDGRDAVREGLRRLIEAYPNKRFLLVLSPAHSPLFGGAAMARAVWHGHPFMPQIPRAAFEAERAAYQDVIDALKALPNVSTVDLTAKTCDQAFCYGEKAGNLLYSDDNHLSFVAAQMFRDDFAPFLQATAP